MLHHDLQPLQAKPARPGRPALGDITGQQNQPRPAQGKARLARGASRRIAKEEKVEQPAAIVCDTL